MSNRIKAVSIKYKGADFTGQIAPCQAIVGPVRVGKSSIIQGILQAGAGHSSIPALQAVPIGSDKAEVILKMSNGDVRQWVAALSSTGATAKDEATGPDLSALFPQVGFQASTMVGPEVFFRNFIRRFGDESRLSVKDAALTINNQLTVEEGREWVMRYASGQFSSLVDVFESINGANQARGRVKGEAKRRADAAHALRKELGVTESFANAAVTKINAAQADVEFWERLCSADLKKYGIKLKGTPDEQRAKAALVLDQLTSQYGEVVEFDRLSREYREQSTIVRDLEAQSKIASGIRAAVKKQMEACIEDAQEEFAKRMAPHMLKGYEAMVVPVSKGLALALKGPKHTEPVLFTAASGFERAAYYYALCLAWGKDGQAPIIVMDTDDLDASNSAMNYLLKKLATAQKKGMVAQVIVVLHDDRAIELPSAFKVMKM